MQHPGRRSVMRVAISALVVLMAVACSEGGEPDAQRQDTPDLAASAPGDTSSPPASPAATPEEYQQVLTELDERLAEGFADVSKVRSPVGLPGAVRSLRGQVDEARAALALISPPETVADAHDDLEAALSDLSAALSKLERQVAASEVCAGGAAVRRVGNSDGAAAVRGAAARLAGTDPVEEYAFGTFVPEGGKQRNRRGRNGDLRPGVQGGLGVLAITGSPKSDSLIKLRIKKRVIRDVYVRSGSEVEVTDLPDGKYDIFIAQGRDWNAETNQFTRGCSFSRLDDKFEFTTTATRYTVWELELLESVLGNAPSTPMDPEDFPN